MFRRIQQALFRGSIQPATAYDSTNKNYLAAASVPSTDVNTDSTAQIPSSFVSANESVGNGINKLIITLSAAPLTVTDANAYGSLQLIDFSKGRIRFLECAASIQFAVTTDRPSTINDNASLTWSLGSAAASNATLTSTMIDAIPKTTKVLAAATTALNTASAAVLASASASLDGTGTAKDLFLNVGFETGTDIDADGTLTATGTIWLLYTMTAHA